MPLPSIVQDSGSFLSAAGVSSLSFTFVGVGAGNTLVSTLAHRTAETRTWTCTDDVDANAYGTVNTEPESRDSYIFWDINVTGGTTQITQTINTGTASWFGFFYELADVAALDVTDSFVDLGNSASHPASSSGVTTATDVIIISCGTSNKSTGTITAAPGFTLDDALANSEMVQHIISATSRVSETATYTSTGARLTYASMVSFKGAAGGGPALTLPQIERHYPRGNSRGLCRGLA